MDIIKAEIPSIVVGMDQKAIAERDELVVKAAEVTAVTTQSDADRASRQAQSMKRLIADTEKDRKRLKKPVTDLGKAIDQAAAKFIEPLNSQVTRIGGLVRGFQAEEEAKAEAERQKQEAEKQKLIAEQKAAEEAAAVAVKNAQRKNAGLSEAEQAILADQEAKRAREEAEEAIRAKPVEAQRTSGTINRKVIRWEITDAKAAYAAYPHWFELVPKRSVINEQITVGLDYAGMRVWEEKVVGFRS